MNLKLISLLVLPLTILVAGCNNQSSLGGDNAVDSSKQALNQSNQESSSSIPVMTVGRLDTFAKCLADKGAKFYGASWCSHCQNQKAAFGTSAKYLPYIECAAGSGQTEICQKENIEGYPTWKFADNTSESGEVSMEVLAQKTGCLLPQ